MTTPTPAGIPDQSRPQIDWNVDGLNLKFLTAVSNCHAHYSGAKKYHGNSGARWENVSKAISKELNRVYNDKACAMKFSGMVKDFLRRHCNGREDVTDLADVERLKVLDIENNSSDSLLRDLVVRKKSEVIAAEMLKGANAKTKSTLSQHSEVALSQGGNDLLMPRGNFPSSSLPQPSPSPSPSPSSVQPNSASTAPATATEAFPALSIKESQKRKRETKEKIFHASNTSFEQSVSETLKPTPAEERLIDAERRSAELRNAILELDLKRRQREDAIEEAAAKRRETQAQRVDEEAEREFRARKRARREFREHISEGSSEEDSGK